MLCAVPAGLLECAEGCLGVQLVCTLPESVQHWPSQFYLQRQLLAAHQLRFGASSPLRGWQVRECCAGRVPRGLAGLPGGFRSHGHHAGALAPILTTPPDTSCVRFCVVLTCAVRLCRVCAHHELSKYALQLCAAAILVLLLPLVPRQEGGAAIAASPAAQAALAAEAAVLVGDGLAAVQVPLLVGTSGISQVEDY